jgi:hypothetical protein
VLHTAISPHPSSLHTHTQTAACGAAPLKINCATTPSLGSFSPPPPPPRAAPAPPGGPLALPLSLCAKSQSSDAAALPRRQCSTPRCCAWCDSIGGPHLWWRWQPRVCSRGASTRHDCRREAAALPAAPQRVQRRVRAGASAERMKE